MRIDSSILKKMYTYFEKSDYVRLARLKKACNSERKWHVLLMWIQQIKTIHSSRTSIVDKRAYILCLLSLIILEFLFFNFDARHEWRWWFIE